MDRRQIALFYDEYKIRQHNIGINDRLFLLYQRLLKYGLNNAKLFSRTVGISYEELNNIVSTRFINPHGDLLPK